MGIQFSAYKSKICPFPKMIFDLENTRNQRVQKPLLSTIHMNAQIQNLKFILDYTIFHSLPPGLVLSLYGFFAGSSRFYQIIKLTITHSVRLISVDVMKLDEDADDVLPPCVLTLQAYSAFSAVFQLFLKCTN